MSVSLREVIEAGGYDLNTLEDAFWLLSKQNEFVELIEQAEELRDKKAEEELTESEAEYKKAFPEEDNDE